MLGLLQLLALGFAIALALATWIVVRRLRNPPRRTYAWAVSRGMPGDPAEMDEARAYTPFEIMLDGVACSAWDIPGDAPGGPVVVCAPGWGDSKLGILVRLDALTPYASRVIAWDSPGLGDTPGTCPHGTSEPAMLVRLARDVRTTESDTVVLYGWSLGASTAIAAAALDGAADQPVVAGVIAEAPYRQAWTPAFAVIRGARLPWRLNGPLAFAVMGLRLTGDPLWRGFDRATHAARLRCPLLIIHGTADTICPYADAQAIAAAAPDATLVPVPDAGHNNLWSDGFREPIVAAVADFLGSFGPVPAEQRPVDAGAAR
jgi:pimeloyl-ACP methyl ester carboxylesterase